MPAAKKAPLPLYKEVQLARKRADKAATKASDAAQPSLPLVSTAVSMEHRRSEVQSIVKTACDFLNADGVEPRNYVEQLAWMFFLKAYDQAEDNRTAARLFEGTGDGEDPDALLSGQFRWSRWTADTSKPDAMLTFVNEKLWPKLTHLGDSPAAQRFQRIFSTVRNYCRRGIIFAKVVEQVNKLHFSDRTDILLLSEIYESLLKQVAADSAGYAGEFYTQRHIIRAMIQVVNPKLGERIYDPCFGSAGFLTECAAHLQKAASMSGDQWDKLQNNTFFGIEFKPLSYLLGHMNMILHGIENANFEMGNTLELHSPNVPSQAKYQVILANPPYGGKLDRQLQTNFTIHSSATEILFLQHIMTNLASGGRAAVIVPEGVLFRGGPDAKVRKRLVEEFNVHTILSLPAGCFLPYTGVKTNIIFFNKERDSRTTQSVWFYELTNDGFELKQTRKPIPGDQLPDFLAKWESRTTGENSWLLPVEDIAKRGYDLSAKNPNRKADEDTRTPLEILEGIKTKQERIAELADEIEEVLVA
jgi:type I restriction enzyme M protein